MLQVLGFPDQQARKEVIGRVGHVKGVPVTDDGGIREVAAEDDIGLWGLTKGRRAGRQKGRK